MRSKFVRKYLRFFRLVYGIEPPYHVLLDGNFIFGALKYKVDIRARLSKLLQENDDKIHLYVLRSSLDEFGTVGITAQPSLKYAKSQCEIIEDTEETGVGMVKYFKNMHRVAKNTGKTGGDDVIRRFVVASQDKVVRQRLGGLAGVPLIYLNKVTMVMEAPTQTSREEQPVTSGGGSLLSKEEEEVLRVISAKKAKEAADQAKAEAEAAGDDRKKRKATAPNPLSAKQASQESQTTKKKKDSMHKRRRL